MSVAVTRALSDPHRGHEMGRAPRRPHPMILIVVQMPIRADRRDEWLVGITRYTDAVRHEPEGPEFECFQSIETPEPSSSLKRSRRERRASAMCRPTTSKSS
jgi:hypothetical protein